MKREAVEDFRLDYEDGFGIRPDEEEDAVAVQGAKAVAAGMKQGLCRRSSASASNPSIQSLWNAVSGL